MNRVLAGLIALGLGAGLTVRDARAAGGQGSAGAAAPPGDGQGEVVVAKQRATTKTFYGWQIIAAGEVGSILAATSVLLPDSPLGSAPATAGFIVGMPIYALAGPIVHWNHGNFTKGMVSFGGNAAFATIGGFIGQSAPCKSEPNSAICGERGFFAGLAVGILIAPVVDGLVLGWENEPINDFAGLEPVRPSRRPLVSIAPVWGVGPRGLELGVAGRF